MQGTLSEVLLWLHLCVCRYSPLEKVSRACRCEAEPYVTQKKKRKPLGNFGRLPSDLRIITGR